MGRLKKTQYTVLMEPAQLDALRDISTRTRVPLQVLAREGVDLVIAKHATKTARRGAPTPRRA